MPPTPTIRDGLRQIMPPWLRRPWAARFLYAPGLLMDGLLQGATDAIFQRGPERCTDDALPYHGRDRRIIRGPGEPRAGYVARLLGWLDAWASAGIGSSMLDQLAAYLTPHHVRIRLITSTGVWYTREADGTFTATIEDKSLWNWDGAPLTRWSRFWLVIYPPPGLWTPGPTWGDAALWGGAWGSPGYTWGSTATPDEVASVRAIVRAWKPGFAKCQNIIIAFDPASFSPTSGDLPAGQYGPWADDDGTGTWVPTRLASARYWDGV